ncbi:MICOS complex subunit MIC25 isoform X2 [Perognathus longimembris pacificus]|uniref:MICOS complex subunit MIC25 isoform X2 n=1 Tax=Perognathus longimembris pacificus TaxID=214514 RepID=UPI0020197C58|nr:MICOS complex subunit MIC25 isoform X2 [Perognathus longimembris pacificus]
MGSAESSESRRVSFEMDEEERVRVLQGIRLSESVVNRMKDSSEPSEGPQPVPPPTAPPSTTAPPTEPPPTETPPTEPPLTTLPPAASSPPTSPLSPRPTATRLPTTRSSPDSSFTFPQKEFKLPKSEPSGIQRPSDVTEEFKRFKEEQAAAQDELFQVVKKEREAASKLLKAPLSPGSSDSNREKRHSVRLARELESREAELQRRDTFYKEQLGRIEKKNAEMYKLSAQQFHEAASKAESAIKPRRVEPVCSGLQYQILRCYRDHLHEVLLCSDLVKEYQHCVSSAHKG